MTDLRKAARDRDCTIRVPGYCNGNRETSVLCHLPGGGMGAKRHDTEAAIGCSSCHDVVDGRVKTHIPKDTLSLWHHEAVIRTNEIWREEGFVVVV